MPSCSLLYGQQRFDEFVDCAKHVLFSGCRDLAEKSVLRGRFSQRSFSVGLSLCLILLEIHCSSVFVGILLKLSYGISLKKISFTVEVKKIVVDDVE